MLESIDEENRQCSICLDCLPNLTDKIYTLKCGHSYCKKCISDIQNICSVCREFKEIHAKNLIVNKFVSFTKILPLTCRPFSKITFYYCSSCNIFITHYSLYKHKLYDHDIISVKKHIIKNIDDLIKNEKIDDIQPQLSIILYIFTNPLILKITKFNTKNNPRRYGSFIFYGEDFNQDANNYNFYKLIFLLLTNFSNDDNIANIFNIKRGYIIGKVFQVIKGYFLIDKNNKIRKAFGLMNFNGDMFFGLMTIDSKVSNGSAVNIVFNYGIYYDGSIYHFGKFKCEERNQYIPFTLEYGEIIDDDVITLIPKFQGIDNFYYNKIMEMYNYIKKNFVFESISNYSIYCKNYLLSKKHKLILFFKDPKFNKLKSIMIFKAISPDSNKNDNYIQQIELIPNSEIDSICSCIYLNKFSMKINMENISISINEDNSINLDRNDEIKNMHYYFEFKEKFIGLYHHQNVTQLNNFSLYDLKEQAEILFLLMEDFFHFNLIQFKIYNVQLEGNKLVNKDTKRFKDIYNKMKESTGIFKCCRANKRSHLPLPIVMSIES